MSAIGRVLPPTIGIHSLKFTRLRLAAGDPERPEDFLHNSHSLDQRGTCEVSRFRTNTSVVAVEHPAICI